MFSMRSLPPAICFLLLLVPSFLVSQPKLSIPQGKVYQLGLVREDTKVSKDLLIQNIGTDTLKLSGIRTSCGCTVAKVTTANIAPGDSTSLHIIINTKDFIDGPVKKDVYFETNDVLQPKVDVVMNIDIRSIIQCLPRYISFSNVAYGDSSIRQEYIKNNTDSTIIIENVISKSPEVSTRFSSVSVAPGDSTAFTAIMHATKLGNLIGQLEIKTNHPQKPSIQVSYIGYVHK